MVCHYHPERESTDTCAICGKEICKECGLEIAGKVYCKDCLQKIIGIGLDDKIEEETVKQPEDNIYTPKEEVQSVPDEPVVEEYHGTIEDSPYNIRDNITYSGGLESSYLHEEETPVKEAEMPAEEVEAEEAPAKEETIKQVVAEGDEFIYPDHSYEPEPTSARLDLEDKYEKYLDDLYFDENEIPLEEQLAKDEEQYGSLTRKPYKPKEEPVQEPEMDEPQKVETPEKLDEPQKTDKTPKVETPEEMEARIRAEILKEQGIEPEKELKDEPEKNIHNLSYHDEKEPMGIVDIILTIILVIVILIVIYYLIYLFVLHNSYPTFIDAVYGLTNPQNVINNLLSNT